MTNHVYISAMTSPFGGMAPDFTVFGAEFDSWWKKLFVGLWALCLIAAGVAFLVSLVKLHKATNNNIPGQADEAKSHAIWAGGALGCLAGFAVITGAIFMLAG